MTPTQTPEDAGELRERVTLKLLWLTYTESPRVEKQVIDCVLELIAAEQTKLLEKLESELPEQEDYLTAPGSSQEEIDAWNKAIDQVRTLLAKHKEGLKQ